MSSISIENAKELYGGANELETARNMADSVGCQKVYKYANDWGDHQAHTDYKQIRSNEEEVRFLQSPQVHNPILIYDRECSAQ